MQCPPTSPGVNGRKFHLVRAAASTSAVRRPSRSKISDKFVHQRDVEVALSVLDHLGRLGDLDRRRTVDPRLDHRAVDGRDPVSGRLVLAGDDLDDLLKPVLAVAGIDAFRRIAEGEIAPAHEARCPLQQRAAYFLGYAGIDGRFEHDDRPAAEAGADQAAGAAQRAEVRVLVGVDRRRDGDDEETRHPQRFGVVRKRKVNGPQILRRHLPPSHPRHGAVSRYGERRCRKPTVPGNRAANAIATGRPT